MKLTGLSLVAIALLQLTSVSWAGVTKAEFDTTISKMQTTFLAKTSSIMLAKLVIDGEWENPTVNAYSQMIGNKFIVKVYGGFAQHKLLTKDGLALALCSELGHGLGGNPKLNAPSSWSTVYGQADYYSTAKCLKKYFEFDDNIGIISKLDIPQTVQKKCSFVFKNENAYAICVRSALAGINIAEMLNSLNPKAPPISIDTPSTTVADSTSKRHPEIQCRLDTYFAGAVCDSDLNDDHDVNYGYCEDRIGYRPLCWYNPLN